MEEASLLEEALKADNSLENTLIIDVFLDAQGLAENAVNNIQSPLLFLSLAETAVSLNQFIQSHPSSYPWISGGDGPVFGVCCSTTAESSSTTFRIAHLRCSYSYGVSVADEWHLIGLVMEYASSQQHKNILVEFWDVDDGQVLLIEAANVLPAWVDALGLHVERSRHVCWLRNGQLYLLRRAEESKAIALQEALQTLRNYGTKQETSSRLHRASGSITATEAPDMMAMIRSKIAETQSSPHWHRAAVALPRRLSVILRRRPDLLTLACGAIFSQDSNPCNLSTSASFTTTRGDSHVSAADGSDEEWVWSTLCFGRTNYAHMRHLLEIQNDWPITMNNACLNLSRTDVMECKRLTRQASVDATPYLKHGVQLGMRIVSGFKQLLAQSHEINNKSDESSNSSTIPESSPKERRLRGWIQLLREELRASPEWLIQAWDAGPNYAKHSLENLLASPISNEYLSSWDYPSPLTHPYQTAAKQAAQELRVVSQKCSTCTTYEQIIPSTKDIDNDDWLDVDATTIMKTIQERSLASLTRNTDSCLPEESDAVAQVLDGVNSFLQSASGVEGVDRSSARIKGEADFMDPAAFLQLFHLTLRTPSSLLASLLPKANEVDSRVSDATLDDVDCKEKNDVDVEVVELMNIMDSELFQSEELSRRLDDQGSAENDNKEFDDKREQVHVLSNLFESLEAAGGEGSRGPVQSILLGE